MSTTDSTKYERGCQLFDEVSGGNSADLMAAFADVSPELPEFIFSFAFGEIYQRPGLQPQQRQLITIGMLTVMGGCEPQLRAHITSALHVGIEPNQIVEVVLHSISYGGFARAINAMVVVKETFDERGLLPVR